MKIIQYDNKDFIVATICVVENENNEILMIKHKRGPFLDLYNCPGGKFEDGEENLFETSINETQDETGVTPENLKYIGEIYFENKENIPNFFVEVHYTNTSNGNPVGENEECFSMWVDKNNLPYNEMQPKDTELFGHILNTEKHPFKLYKKIDTFFELGQER